LNKNIIKMGNKDLPISQLTLANQLDGNEWVPFAKDKGNGAFLLSLLRTFISEGLATQTSVDSKQNRLIAGKGISISSDNTISSTLDVSLFRIVDVLPTADIENKIYLIKDTNGKEGENEYLEYLYVNGKWELIGKYTATVDLTPYMKKADAEAIYAKKTELPDTGKLADRTTVEALASGLAEAKRTISAMQTKLEKLPDIPPNDGKCYALMNGAWVVIADDSETILTVNDEITESQS